MIFERRSTAIQTIKGTKMASGTAGEPRPAALLTFVARILPDRILGRVFAVALRPHFPKYLLVNSTSG
jgi:hypothetical protein